MTGLELLLKQVDEKVTQLQEDLASASAKEIGRAHV